MKTISLAGNKLKVHNDGSIDFDPLRIDQRQLGVRYYHKSDCYGIHLRRIPYEASDDHLINDGYVYIGD